VRSSKSRRIESQSSNLFLEREPVVLRDRAVSDLRELFIFGDHRSACRRSSPIAFPKRGARALFRSPCRHGIVAKHR
jgi:hypothetical protein